MKQNPFEGIFDSVIAEQLAQQMRNAANAMNGQATSANSWSHLEGMINSTTAAGAGLPNSQTLQPGERKVTPAIQDEMLIRRTGNVLKDAGEAGWRVQEVRRSVAFTGIDFQFQMVRGDRLVRAPAANSRKQALVNVAQCVAVVLGIGN